MIEILKNFVKGDALMSPWQTADFGQGQVWSGRDQPARLPRAQAGIVKRTLDIAVSSLLLVMLLPLFCMLAIVIKLDSRGSVLFSQTRVGYAGRHFRIWKFRSMTVDAPTLKSALLDKNEIEGNLLFKIKNDTRVTRSGKFIRKFSLDELPQLWNVLTGDMSLVGPRPAVPEEVREYSQAQRKRLFAVPGITCIWQVSGRSLIPFEQQVKMDVHYIENQSLWLDFKLLLLTIPAVLTARGSC